MEVREVTWTKRAAGTEARGHPSSATSGAELGPIRFGFKGLGTFSLLPASRGWCDGGSRGSGTPSVPIPSSSPASLGPQLNEEETFP